MTLSLFLLGIFNQTLLLPGSYHGEEVNARSGDLFWAIFQGSEQDSLDQVPLVVTPYFDPIMDQDQEKTGKSVSVQKDQQPLFLVAGIPGLKKGPIQRSNLPQTYLSLDQSLSIPWGDQAGLLSWKKESESKDYPNIARFQLVFESAGKTQVLGQFEVYFPSDGDPQIASEGQPALIWAGDLNHDGALDLLIDMTDHYNVSEPTLFLSQPDGAGLLKLVCAFRTTGC